MNLRQIGWDQVWGPWLTLLGVVFLCVGISDPDQKLGNIPMSHLADGVGAGAFLFGMSNIVERLRKGQDGMRNQFRDEIRTLSEENRELNKVLTESLIKSSGALTALMERDLAATRRIWELTSTLYDLTETTYELRNQDSHVVRVSGTMIENVVKQCTNKLARDIRAVLGAGDFSLEVRDFSPITEYLEALVAALPDHSCWLGLSRLTLPGAWEADLSSRADWNSMLLAKASDQKIWVCRVWILNSLEDLRLIKNEMRHQSEKGVIVRYYIANQGDELREAQDMSLIWTPGIGKHDAPSDLLGKDPITTLRNNGFQRLQGLVFDVNSGINLTSMRIVTPDQTHVLQQTFSQVWVKATSQPSLTHA